MTVSVTATPPAEVELWVFPLDPGERLGELQATLAPDEQARAARFVYADDRERFIVGRGLLRTIVASYLDTSPATLEILAGPQQKPYLAPGDRPLYFNLSHSGDYGALAVTRACEIGVDIEKVRAIEPGFAQRFYTTAENAAIASLPEAEQNLAILRCWSRKEAVLKAHGVGLLGDFKSFDVTIGAEGVQRVAGLSGPWALTAFTPAQGYVGAIAARAAAIEVAQKELSSVWR